MTERTLRGIPLCIFFGIPFFTCFMKWPHLPTSFLPVNIGHFLCRLKKITPLWWIKVNSLSLFFSNRSLDFMPARFGMLSLRFVCRNDQRPRDASAENDFQTMSINRSTMVLQIGKPSRDSSIPIKRKSQNRIIQITD